MAYQALVDLDGVVADFVSGALELHGDRFRRSTYESLRGEEAWNIQGHFDGPPEEFWGAMGYGFWRNLPKCDDADDIVQTVIDYLGVENVCFLTSPIRTPGCYEGKRDWAHEHYPDIPLLFSTSAKNNVEGQLPPKQFVADCHKILIDDHTDNVRRWTERDGIGFLIPRRWNAKHDDIRPGLERLDHFLFSVSVVNSYRQWRVPKGDPVPAA